MAHKWEYIKTGLRNEYRIRMFFNKYANKKRLIFLESTARISEVLVLLSNRDFADLFDIIQIGIIVLIQTIGGNHH